MEEKIKELNDYLSSKQQHLLTFSSMTSEMLTKFPIPIDLNSNRNYKAALLWFSAYNTVFNINESNNNFRYIEHKKEYSIKLDPGAYEIKKINEEIQRKMGTPGITISVDRSTSKSTLLIKKDIIIDFTIENSLREMLGFDKKFITEGFHKSDHIVQITNFSTINIECNIIQNSYINGKQSNIIYSFPSYTVPVGYKIIERIAHPIYLPVVKTSAISSIFIRIVNELGNTINFNGEEISLAIEIRQV